MPFNTVEKSLHRQEGLRNQGLQNKQLKFNHSVFKEKQWHELISRQHTAASGGRDTHQEVRADNTFACHLITGCN